MSTLEALAGYPKTVVLTDGAHLVLRPLGADEETAFRQLVGRLPAPRTVGVGSTAGALRIGAFDAERLAAVLTLHPRPGGTDARSAELALGLDPQYHHRRLGTWMLLDGVHLAADLGIERLVARLPASDAAYRAALRRLDFVEEAASSEPAGVIVLGKTLHGAWTDF